MPRIALAMLLALSPNSPNAYRIARVIAHAAHSRAYAAALATISLHENGIGRAGVPFGVTDAWRIRPRSETECARIAIRILRRGRIDCGTRDWAIILGRFHSGRCQADDFSREEARDIARLLR